MQPQIYKSPDEIQRAHDLLIQMLLDNERTSLLSDLELLDAMAYASVLCWLLGHTHNPSFATNLRELEMRLEAAGVEVVDLGQLTRLKDILQ